ncbi:MAG: hypothetical protein QOI70_1006, partial [Microbacteriaceae bacterium]|nr:hypothetical protein [Microbacteriaceae bacterium]
MTRPAVSIAVLDSAGAPCELPFDIRQEWTAGSEGFWTVSVLARYAGLTETEANLRASTGILNAPDPWWLIPGGFYGQNRPEGNDRVFPRFGIGATGAEDAERMTSNAWEFRADRTATPAVFAWGGAGLGGAAMAASENTALGQTGVGFAHDSATGSASIHLTFPYREGPVSYYGDDVARPALIETYRWTPGETIELSFTVHELAADRHAYAPVLRTIRESTPTRLRPWVSVDSAADLTAEGLLRWHYDPDPGILLETVGFDRGVSGRDGKSVDRQAMHVGWISGIPWAYALLRHGMRRGLMDEVAAGKRVIDFIAGNLSPSGTFWGTWYRESGWTQSWSVIKRGLHSRTLAEATLFLVRALALRPDEATWSRAVRSNLDAVVARQRADGNLGSVHHAETGEVLSWAGSAGLTWVAALAEAAG